MKILKKLYILQGSMNNFRFNCIIHIKCEDCSKNNAPYFIMSVHDIGGMVVETEPSKQ